MQVMMVLLEEELMEAAQKDIARSQTNISISDGYIELAVPGELRGTVYNFSALIQALRCEVSAPCCTDYQ